MIAADWLQLDLTEGVDEMLFDYLRWIYEKE